MLILILMPLPEQLVYRFIRCVVHAQVRHLLKFPIISQSK